MQALLPLAAAACPPWPQPCPLTRHFVDDPGALCLDGSPAALYHRPGSRVNLTKWYIHHEGGGWCSTAVPPSQTSVANNCWNRTRGDLGSSKSYPPTMVFDSGYFWTNAEWNPQLWDWNVAVLRYCDGGSFSGEAADPVPVEGGGSVYFRGGAILRGAVRTLLALGLADATDVVLGGASAGALSVYLHANWWRQQIPPSAFMAAMPDSGFFLDYSGPGPDAVRNIASELRRMYGERNVSSQTAGECAAMEVRVGGSPERCMLAEHAGPFVSAPLFVINSVYDTWQLQDELGSTDPEKVNAYGKVLASRLAEAVAGGRRGGWVDSCAHHVSTGQWAGETIDNRTLAEAFELWYTDQRAVWEGRAAAAQPQRVWAHPRPYPCKACCGNS